MTDAAPPPPASPASGASPARGSWLPALASVPRLHLHVSASAPEAQRLPALATTALHGALGHALAEVGCQAVSRCAPGACARAGEGCPVACVTLAPPGGFEVAGAQPLVAAPLPPLVPIVHAHPIVLDPGERVAFRLTLFGAAAVGARAFAARAVERALERGLGVVDAPPTRGRPRALLGAAEVHEVAAAVLSFPSEAVDRGTLSLVTPLRLQVDGAVQRRFHALELRRALLRRARSLTIAYGEATEAEREAFVRYVDAELRRDESPWYIERADTRVVPIRRFSSRQEARMEWPGVVGELHLEGDLGPDLPLFVLASEAHLGKNTSFGFGQLHLR